MQHTTLNRVLTAFAFSMASPALGAEAPESPKYPPSCKATQHPQERSTCHPGPANDALSRGGAVPQGAKRVTAK